MNKSLDDVTSGGPVDVELGLAVGRKLERPLPRILGQLLIGPMAARRTR